MRIPAPHVHSMSSRRWWLLCGLAAGVLLAWQSVSVNRRWSCVVEDTPYLTLCPAMPGTPRAEALRARIASGPGDSAAYVALASAEGPPQRQKILEAARRVAPNEPNILLLSAASALEAGDWDSALPTLVQLVEYRDHEAAALVLARLVGAGEGRRLEPHLSPGSRWFTLVVKQLSQLPESLRLGVPLLHEALKRDAVDPGMRAAVIQQLKDLGAWADAYSLWLSGHPRGLPLLFNGGFDSAFEPSGFDWELRAPAPRAGAVPERRPESGRGFVLAVRFTGASVTSPLARQYLFVSPGRYRVQGEFETRNLKLESGLAWVVRCATGSLEAGRSQALQDTGGRWQPFSFDVTISPACGAVASLQLEPFSPATGAVGGLGQVAFDAFSITR